MAFNTAAFKTRTITALFFAVIMLLGLLINQWTFFILFVFIHAGCWIEYQKIVGNIDKDYIATTPFHKYAIILAGACLMVALSGSNYMVGNISLQIISLWFLCFLLVAIILNEIIWNKILKLKLLLYSLAGLLYISVSLGLMLALRTSGIAFEGTQFSIDFGWIIPVIIIATIWINDTTAYIVGSFIGKTPLSKISPKKTWEGTLGGAVLAVITVTLLSSIILKSDYLPVFIIALISVCMGTFGDLFESKLKRMAKVKDSGTIMPGHGGFLDRFDSLLMATPFVWLFVKFFL